MPTTKFHLHPLASAIVSLHLYLQVSYCIPKVTHRHAPTLSNVTVTSPSHCDHEQWWQYHHPTTSMLSPPLLTSQVCMFTHSPSTLTCRPPYSTTACTQWQCLCHDSTHRYVGSPHVSVTLTSYQPTCTHCGLLQQQQRQQQWLSPT